MSVPSGTADDLMTLGLFASGTIFEPRVKWSLLGLAGVVMVISVLEFEFSFTSVIDAT